MGQLRTLFFRLDLRQRISLAVVAIVVILVIWLGIRWNRDRDLKPLFTDVAAEDAGALVERLRAANVEYKVSDNGTILVQSARVAELRLEMAAAGLPRTGRIGFELFDKANFGATDFAEHVNFRRALEGELERSVMALVEVERARVHVTFPKDSVFLDRREPAKASVMVKLRPGAQLSPQHILGITHLTASAVEGLDPGAVSVLDMSGALLNRPRRGSAAEDLGATDAMMEYRVALERDYQSKIRATLDPLLGENKYRSGVSIDCDFTSGEQSEELFDPERSVMVTSQKTEDISGSAVAGGVPGTASNLPRPVSKPPGGGAGVSRTTESISYQTSRVVKHLKIPQGALKRISVSVLVDQDVRWEGTGANAKRVLIPPSPERLKVVRDVLAGVVGFQQDRGDQILVETLPFESSAGAPPPEAEKTPAAAPRFPALPPWAAQWVDKVPGAVWLGSLAALVLISLTAVFALARKRRKRNQSLPDPSASRSLAASGAPQEVGHKALPANAQSAALVKQQEQEVLANLRLPQGANKGEVLRKHIGEIAQKDPVATAQLLRTWLNEEQR